MKRCYYQILDVDRKATAAEIKTNYRKMALKFHPDKNPSQDAKQRFVQINEAYNVLSDPNERTWYDNNREKILFNKEEMSKEDIQQYTFGFNIWLYFTTSCFKGYEDDQTGFYAVYRDVFQKIKTEETKAFNMREDLEQEQRKLEGFGDSTTAEHKLLQFYQDWQNFTTYKTFVWSEEWDTRDANARWMRREMEKENKKQRTAEKKTYIKTIKDLVAYVRKRDPRFIEHVRKQKEEEAKKEAQRLQREREKKIEKEKMREVGKQLEQERFRQIEEYYRKQQIQMGGKNEMYYTQEEDERIQFYCELCDKPFKSQNQLRNHEKSKQHKQMVKQVQKEVMMKEDINRQIDEEEESPEKIEKQESPEKDESPQKKNKKKKRKNQMFRNQIEEVQEEKEEQEEKPKKQNAKTKKQQPKKKVSESSESDDDDAFMNQLLNNRNKKTETKTKEQPKIEAKVEKQPENKKKKGKVQMPQPQPQSEQQGQEEQGKKLNKAKLKKQKKAEQQKNKQSGFSCKVCNESFPSKTKLFDHIKKLNHATAK